MHIDLSGKTALVMASTGGIRFATASGLAGAGVTVNVRSAEEVANLIVYLASPRASATTGAELRVDGGLVDSIAYPSNRGRRSSGPLTGRARPG